METDGKDTIDQNEYMRQKIKALFQTPQGKEVLDYWVEAFLHVMPVANIEKPNYAYYREGQNSLIRDLLHLTKEKV